MLLQNLGLQKRLAQGVVDWLDDDLETKIPDGAEDSYYLNLDQPYRTANTSMVSASELRLVKGFDDVEVYKKLLPHVCAFGISAPININTASAEVLRSLGDELSESDIESVITQREDQAFNDLNEFQNSSTLKDKITSLEDLSVNSEYFMLRTESTIGQIRYVGYSIIHRNDVGTARVIARSQGVY
jgi:general secretion pathway protein K